MTVTGIITKPAEALAIAPVVMFATWDSLGKLEDEDWALPADDCTTPVDVRRFDLTTCWRNVLREVK